MLSFPVQEQDETYKEKIKVLLSLLSDKGWYTPRVPAFFIALIYVPKIMPVSSFS